MNLTVDVLGIGDIVGQQHQQRFDTIDYVVFSLMLLLSALTGLYYGCFHGRTTATTTTDEPQDSNAKFNDFLTGDKKMKFFPVSMSLVASYVSGVTILGTPAEVYDYGTQYCLIIVSIWIMGIVVGTVYMPVFRQNELKSSYEYLEKRFDKSIRLFASIMFLVDEILFLPMVIYVPSLAFNQVTGINLHVIGTIVTAVCIFYTVLGGIRAVVWTDTWQIITMFISVLIVTVLGTIEVGGFMEVIRKNLEKNRIQFFNLSTSLYERQSVLSVLIGGTFYWTAYNSVNQTMVQRYLSLPTLKESRKSLIMFTIGVSLFVGVCCFSGLLIFATYDNCDPLTDGKINANDQLLPLFVMQTVGHLKGIPGLFVAGVFGAALSSLSVILNSTSIVILEDLMKSSLKINLSTRSAQIFVKFAVMFLGFMAILFLYIVEHLGGVLSTAASLSAIAASTSFGLFSLGMLFPQANSRGALCGGIAGALTSGWISLGTQYATITHKLVAHKLPVSIEGCLKSDLSTIVTTAASTLNSSLPWTSLPETQGQNEDASSIFPLYRLSFHWITPIGSLTVIGVGLAVSFLTGGTDYKTLNPMHMSPVLKYLMSAESYRQIGRKHGNELKMTDLP